MDINKITKYLKNTLVVLLLSVLVAPLFAQNAHALPLLDSLFGNDDEWMNAGGCGTAGTIGFAMCNLVISISTLPTFLVAISYLFGLVLGFFGLHKLREHIDSPGQTPLWEPVKRFLAGGMFIALPTIVDALKTSVNWGIARGEVSGFNVNGAAGSGLDTMLVSLIDNIWMPMQFLIGSFAWLAGLVMIMVGISRLLKTAQEGARGPGGLGTMMTFITGAALLSADSMMAAVSGSIFLSNNYATYGILQTTAGLTAEQEGHINAVIGSIVGFMVILGWVSFIRGFFIIRGYAEGDGQASIMAGITHIIGGALAVNIGSVLNAVQFTLGLDTFGVIFS